MNTAYTGFFLPQAMMLFNQFGMSQSPFGFQAFPYLPYSKSSRSSGTPLGTAAPARSSRPPASPSCDTISPHP